MWCCFFPKGIGSGTASVEECINLAKRKAFEYQWKNCKHLIIDEISMVDGDYFKVRAFGHWFEITIFGSTIQEASVYNI